MGEGESIGLRAGILAATSIGEVGTQSTMKVFQQGGKGKISSSDLGRRYNHLSK